MLRYLHFGRQCPWATLEDRARDAALLLNQPFVSEDVRDNPQLAREYQLVFPGLIVVDGLKIGFPGSAEELAECIRTRAPLPGIQEEYRQLPEEDPDHVELLGPHNIDDIHGICLPADFAPFWCEKVQWLHSLQLPCLGLVGYKEGRPVAIVETLPRELVPYPVPEYKGLFITCIYGRHDAELDYRRGLLRMGMPLLKEQGCAFLGVVAGRGTPYPNGPAELLAKAGFRETADLGSVIMRHRWAEQVFMQSEL